MTINPYSLMELTDIYCAKCEKLARVVIEPRHDRDVYVATVQCHGESHTATIANSEWFLCSPLDARILFHTKFPFLDNTPTAGARDRPAPLPQTAVELPTVDLTAHDAAALDAMIGTIPPEIRHRLTAQLEASIRTERETMLRGNRDTLSYFGIPIVVDPTPQPPAEGQELTLDHFAYNLERCRALVSGLTVRDIILGDTEFDALIVLLEEAGPLEPYRFRRSRSGTVAYWREQTIRPHSRIGPLPPCTLDMSGVPLRYTNQNGTIMEIWPPWIARQTTTTRPQTPLPFVTTTGITANGVLVHRDELRRRAQGASWGRPLTPMELAADAPTRPTRRRPASVPADPDAVARLLEGPRSGRHIVLRKKPPK